MSVVAQSSPPAQSLVCWGVNYSMLLLVPKPPTPPPSPLRPPTAASVGDWNERYIRTLPPEALKNQDLSSFTLHQELQGLRSSCFTSLTDLSAHFNFNCFVSMQLLSSLVSLLLVLYSVRAAAVLPVEERNLAQSRVSDCKCASSCSFYGFTKQVSVF